MNDNGPLRGIHFKTNFAQLLSLPINKQPKLYNSLHYTYTHIHIRIKKKHFKKNLLTKKLCKVSTPLKINKHETTLRALSNDYWLLLYMHDTYIHSININFTYITKFTKCFLQSLHIYRQFL